jgi:hypothetical protein
MNPLGWIKLLAGLFSQVLAAWNARTLKKAGADEAELEQRKKDEKLIASINAEHSDERVLDELREKYKRKP